MLSILLSFLLIQLHSLCITWLAYVHLRNNALLKRLLAQRNRLLRKLKRKRLSQLLRKPGSIWYQKGRTDPWWENMINSLPEGEWNFRLSRQQFFTLLEELKSHIAPCQNLLNYRALSAVKKLAVTLYYLKDTGSLRTTAKWRFILGFEKKPSIPLIIIYF